jgi:hypothetical protein
MANSVPNLKLNLDGVSACERRGSDDSNSNDLDGLVSSEGVFEGTGDLDEGIDVASTDLGLYEPYSASCWSGEPNPWLDSPNPKSDHYPDIVWQLKSFKDSRRHMHNRNKTWAIPVDATK